jgi:hypothetical protein
MKKFLAVAFALLLIATTNTVAFAAGSFVSSPTGQNAPVLVEFDNESEECEAEVKITAYSDREALSEEAKNDLVEAYEAIAGAEDIGTLSADIAAVADKLGLSSKALVVSDLFDVSYSNCDVHQAHRGFTITIKPTSVENFAAILHYEDAEWEVIEGSVENGEIVFFTESLSPFAIMVYEGTPVEQPSDNVSPWFVSFLLLILLLVIALIVWLTSKKKKAQGEQKQ